MKLLSAITACLIFLSSPVLACADGTYALSDGQILEETHKSFPEDAVYAFVGEDYLHAIRAIESVFGDVLDETKADEIYVSVGNSVEPGALLIAYNKGCQVGSHQVTMEEFKPVLDAYGPVDPVYAAGKAS